MGKNTKSKKSTKSGEALRKEALAVTEGNLARIEAQERGEAAAPENKAGDTKPKKTKGGKSAKQPKEKKPRKMSGLDAAAKVLLESKEPLTAQAMVDAAFAQGLWKSNGKTPAATVYAAIIREIAAKGKEARFKKVDRGMFAANK
jgi:hypothetical protein